MFFERSEFRELACRVANVLQASAFDVANVDLHRPTHLLAHDLLPVRTDHLVTWTR